MSNGFYIFKNFIFNKFIFCSKRSELHFSIQKCIILLFKYFLVKIKILYILKIKTLARCIPIQTFGIT